MKRTLQLVLSATMMGLCLTAGGLDRPKPNELDKETLRLFTMLEGGIDPGIWGKLVDHISVHALVSAFYSDNRSVRLIALEAAGYVDSPLPLLPYLAVLMRASDRQTASRAAASVLRNLERISQRVEGACDVVPGQIVQLARMLTKTASNDMLAVDIRASSLQAVIMLSRFSPGCCVIPKVFLKDSKEAVRASALSSFDVPLKDEDLSALAEMVQEDSSPMLRGQSVALLCENALSHGVEEPSQDLTELMLSVIESFDEAESAAVLLGCLIRFKPSARAEIVEAALKNSSSSVKEYWESLSKNVE